MASALLSNVSRHLARQHQKFDTTIALKFATRSYLTHSQLPEEHQMIHDMCRKFADEELAPHAGKWDKEHTFPEAAVKHLVSAQPKSTPKRPSYLPVEISLTGTYCFIRF
jgi:hypothetical protein